MPTEAQNAIRAIRRALGMSQAEFGHALGWSPSTISRWESGRGEPSRLALKIILAYGEERRVRYRPRGSDANLPVPIAGPALPAVAPARLPTVEVVPASSGAWGASARAERPRWEATLSLRIATKDRATAAGSRRGWLRSTAAVAAGACAAVLIGVPLMERSAPAPEPRVSVAAPTTPPPVAVAPEVPPPVAIAATVPAPPPEPPRAELEGVTVLGGRRQATFRIATDTVTIAEGEPLGERRAAHIGVDGVDLTDASGAVRRVKLGEHVALE